jgi:hypothetical protein
VIGKSLSTVLGTPIQIKSYPNWAPNRETL